MARDTDAPTTDPRPAHAVSPTPDLPPANDPGGAHAKGYSADPNPHAPDVPEPVPLADAPPGGIHVPERDDGVQPTGRSALPDDPNNRVVSPE